MAAPSQQKVCTLKKSQVIDRFRSGHNCDLETNTLTNYIIKMYITTRITRMYRSMYL